MTIADYLKDFIPQSSSSTSDFSFQDSSSNVVDPATEEQQKLLLQALELAASSSVDFDTRRKVLESVNYIQETLDAHSGAVKNVLAPEDDDRLLKKKYRSSANSNETNDSRSSFSHGAFSKLERQRVQEAIDEYLAEKGIPHSDLYYLIHRKTRNISQQISPLTSKPVYVNPYSASEYKGFIKTILERSKINRSLDQLYWFMSRAYSAVRTEGRKWSMEDDDRLRFLVNLKGNKWKEIERELGRSDCKNRWKKIQRDDSGQKIGRWEPDEEERFKQGLEDLMTRHEVTDMSQFNRWSELADIVRTRSDVQCRNKYIHDFSKRPGHALFTRKLHWSLEDDRILLARMLTLCSKAQDETMIIWENLCLPNWTWIGVTLRDRWLKLASKIPNSDHMTFAEKIQYCLKNVEFLSIAHKKKREIFIEDDDEPIERAWTLEDSQELLSRLCALYRNVSDESEVDWRSLTWSPWNGKALQHRWMLLCSHVIDADAMSFSELMQYCRENLTKLEEAIAASHMEF